MYYVLEVARQHNFSRAAEALFTTQSNISQRISLLESELHTQLFIRSRQSVDLTPAGEVFCKYAQEIVDTVSKIEHTFEEKNEDAPLTVAVYPFFYAEGMMSPIKLFHRDHPDIQLSIKVADNYLAYAGMDEGSIDLSILKLRENHKLKRYEYIPLAEEDLLCLISADNPYADRGSIGSEELPKLPLLTGETDTYLHDVMSEVYRERHAQPHVTFMNSYNTDLVTEMIAENDGVTFATESVAHILENKRVKAISLDPPIKYHTYLVYPKNKMLTESFSVLADHIVRSYTSGD